MAPIHNNPTVLFPGLPRAAAPESRSAATETSGDRVDLNSARLPSADLTTHRARLLADMASVTLPHVTGYSGTSGQEAPFNEEPSNRDVNQTGIEQDLISDLGSAARIQNHQDVSQLEGRLISTDELNTEFAKLAADPAIPFEYIVDGCYARAHLMCETMKQDDVNCAKMFVMLANPWGSGKLEAQNKYQHARWWYHVAPLVFAQNTATQQVEAYIMDPSMADHPLKAEDWVHQMWDEQTPIKVDITRAPQWGPYESEGANRTFEESLEPSRDVARNYSAELAEIKEQYCHDHPEECQRPAA